ncbi:MAG: polysulfide reductase NrfD [Deltaproteobacteria bacterium]|nr:polysulfide reductase NrfD [Deltaproteobacteria bacterium]
MSGITKTGKSIFILAWLALLVWGIYGVFQRFTLGHRLADYGSYVTWGLWVSSYIYFIGLSAGAFLLSALIYVFRLERLERIGKTALFTAAITLVMALITIFFDLGHEWRFYKVFTSPHFSSMMAWMVWLYTAYFILILTELWLILRCDLDRLAREGGALAGLYRVLSLGWNCPEDQEKQKQCHENSIKLLRPLAAFGIPLATAFHGGVGALFATVGARALWHTPLFPILFLIGALVSGGALMLALVAIFPDIGGSEQECKAILSLLGKIVLGLICVDLLLEFAEFFVPLWSGIGPELAGLKEILLGRFWYVFWIFHIGLGSVIPIALLAFRPQSRIAAGLAGVLIAVTYLAVRLNMVIPGLITPELKGVAEAFVQPRLTFTYIPSAFEWSVLAFVVAMGIGIFFIGKRILPLESTPGQLR